jgi:hypothetical protein
VYSRALPRGFLGVVEEYHQMDAPTGIFKYINIRACWPTSDEDLARYAQQVSPRGREAPAATPPADARDWALQALTQIFRSPVQSEGAMNRHGILQMYLLCMEPFQGCNEDQVRDSRIRLGDCSQRLFTCANRPLLIEASVDALLAYETDIYLLREQQQTIPQYIQEGMDRVATGLRFYVDLYRRKRLPSRPVAPMRVEEILQGATQALEVLTPEVYRQEVQVLEQRVKEQLIAAMVHAFEQYGPPARRYPLGAMWHALALMLARLGLEQGTDYARIAERLRRQHARTARRSIST